MALVTAYGALKVNQFICMAFALGMCFFPVKLMDGYKADSFKGTASTCFQFFMGIMGTQILLMAFLSASAAREQVPKKVQSVGCLLLAIYWAFFAVSDGSLPLRNKLPEAFPPEAIYGNVCLFLFLSAVMLMGWIEGGKATPDFKALMPKGRPKMAVSIGMANLAFFAIGCTFFTEPFLEMFLPGVVERLPGAISTKHHPVGPLQGPVPPIMVIIFNAGVTMLFAIATTLAMCSVGDEDTSYRVLRAWVMQGTFYFGTLARDGVLDSATGWPAPMRVATFVQCFITLFVMADTMTKIPYTLLDDDKADQAPAAHPEATPKSPRAKAALKDSLLK